MLYTPVTVELVRRLAALSSLGGDCETPATPESTLESPSDMLIELAGMEEGRKAKRVKLLVQ